MRDRTTEQAPKQTEKAKPEPAPAPAPEPSPLLTLQRQAGNAAVVAMLDDAPTIQAKLQVGAVNDPAEAEADRMADQVLRSLEAGAADKPVSRLSRMVRRSGAAPGSDAPGHGFDGGPVSPDVEQGIAKARGGGQPLDEVTRSEMESGFGADFSGIRVHTGGQADTLSRSLNAKAFTTGNDIFFSSGQVDRKVLAHELAHTVQQGAAPVRRFMKAEEFAKLTYQSMFTAKSTAQTTIEGFLTQYKALGMPVAKKGDKAPAPVTEGVTVPDSKIDNALELLRSMQRVAQAYIGNKEKTDSAGVAAKDKKTKILGEDRNKRVDGFKWFLTAVSQEIVKMENRKVNLGEGDKAKQDAITVDTSGKQKVVDKYEGNLGTILGLCGTAIGAVCSVNGDQSDLEIKVTIPIPPNFFAGGTLRFGAKRDDDLTTVTCDALFTGGAKFGVADLNAGLGGYFKITAKDPQTAMKLMSYGMYRRCKESPIIPAWVSAGIWGEKGDETGDSWSKRVEKDELGKGSKQSVEMGGMAEVGADVTTGILNASAAASLRSGKKYDAESLEKTKGGAGADNKKGDNWYAQKSTGLDVGNVEVRGKLDFSCPFADTKAAVDSKLQIAWRDNKEKDAKGKDKGSEIDLVFWELRGNMRFPSNGFAGKVASGSTAFGLWIKDQIGGEFKKLDAKGVATQVVTKGYVVADASTTGLHDVGFADYIEQKLKAPDATPKPDPNAKKADPDQGRIGVEFAYTYKSVKGQPTQIFEVRQLVENSVKVPEILKVTLQRRKRVVGLKKVGPTGSWTFVA